MSNKINKIEIGCKGSRTILHSKLKPFQGSLKEMSKLSAEKLKASILKYGWRFPVFVWNDGKTDWIHDGHGRLLVLAELLKEGYTIDALPVVDIHAKDRKEAAELLLAVNSKYQTITEEGLYQFMHEMDLKMEDLTVFDLPDIDMEQFEAGYFEEENDGLTDPDDIPETPVEPVTRSGDLYILGRHRLLCGDSTNITDVERLMDGKKADMVFTDPPYGVSYVGKTKDALTIKNDAMDEDGTAELWLAAYSEARAVLRDGGGIYVTVPPGPLHLLFAKVMYDFNDLRQIIIYVKDRFVLGRSDYHYRHEPILYGWKSTGAHEFYGGRDKDTVWEIVRPSANKEHPTMKPLELIERAINNSSQSGQAVLDLFLGSGSTLIACEKTGRICYGMEIDESYTQVIIKRWEDFTGKKAILEETGETFDQVKQRRDDAKA